MNRIPTQSEWMRRYGKPVYAIHIANVREKE